MFYIYVCMCLLRKSTRDIFLKSSVNWALNKLLNDLVESNVTPENKNNDPCKFFKEHKIAILSKIVLEKLSLIFI